VQVVGWYDELLRLTGRPVTQPNLAFAIGEADVARGSRGSGPVDPARPATVPPRRSFTRKR